MADEPGLAGAVQVTVADPEPAVAVGVPGALGALGDPGVTIAEGMLGGLTLAAKMGESSLMA